MSPPDEPFRVSVFPQDSTVRDRVIELLKGVRPESTHVYEGVVDGWADQACLDQLHEMGVSVVVPRATAAPSMEPTPAQAQAGVEAAAPATGGAPADGAGVGVDAREATAPAAAEEPLVLRRSKWLEPNLRETLQWLSTTVPAGETLPEDVMQVYLREAIRQEWRDALAQQGEIRSEITPTVVEMRIAADKMAAVSALPYVQSIRRAGIATTVTPALLDALQGAREAATEAVDAADAALAPVDFGLAGAAPEPEPPPAETFDVVLHTSDTMAEVKAVLAERNDVEVVGESATTLRFRAPVDPVLVARLGKVSGVKSLSTYTAPVLFCDHVRTLLGIQFQNGNAGGVATLEWDGTGQVVGIVDSGVDGEHPGLVGQVQEAFAVPGALAEDRVGHGTHVASIIAGTGKYRVANGAGAEEVKEGPVRGIAPGARLVCLGIVDEHGTLRIDAFVDLGDLLKLAVEKGAKILNLSWGSPVGGSYDHGSESVDRFVYEHPDVLVVIAAGNFGEWDTGRGDLRFNTVAAPASAKNVLTVGASATDRAEDTFGGEQRLFNRPWSEVRKSRFAGPPPLDRAAAGDPDLPAAISSRGPTDHDSCKPDVMAPGTYILAARAKGIPDKSYEKPCDEYGGHYAYMTGSSMSAPAVAGAAAVLRQYLVSARGVANPSAALLKAVIIASARRMKSVIPEALADKIGFPDFDQGFGRVDLSTILSPTAGRKLAFTDVPNDSPGALQSRAEVGAVNKALCAYRVRTAADATGPLRVVLAWTDFPGNQVQNNLQLEVRGAGGVWIGNQEHNYRKDPLFDDVGPNGFAFDKRNTVELVHLEEPAADTEYQIRVLAQNTSHPTQGYALCVVGALVDDALTEQPSE